MRARASDNGYPVKHSEITVSFTVHHNEFMPQWVNAPYRQTVNEDIRNMTGNGPGSTRGDSVLGDGHRSRSLLLYCRRVGRTTGYILITNNLKLDRGLGL